MSNQVCHYCKDYDKASFYHGSCSHPMVTIDVFHYHNPEETLTRQATDDCGFFGKPRRRMELDMDCQLP